MIFQAAKIEASWENCLSFLASENFDAEILTAYLNSDSTLVTLSQHLIPDGEKAFVLRKFLIEAGDLRDEAYRSYVRALPKPFTNFPQNLEASKLQILIEEQRATFSEENFSTLSDDDELQILFVTKNIEHFLSNENDFEIDDEFRERLLRSDLPNEYKVEIAKAMDLTQLVDLPSRAAVVGPIFDNADADMSKIDAQTALAIVLNSAPVAVQISLFNKCQVKLGDDDVRQILTALPEPFSGIKTGYSSPRIKNTKENVELVKWLDSREIISSWSETYFGDEIRINLRRR